MTSESTTQSSGETLFVVEKCQPWSGRGETVYRRYCKSQWSRCVTAMAATMLATRRQLQRTTHERRPHTVDVVGGRGLWIILRSSLLPLVHRLITRQCGDCKCDQKKTVKSSVYRALICVSVAYAVVRRLFGWRLTQTGPSHSCIVSKRLKIWP